MSATEELQALKAKVAELKQAVDAIDEVQWAHYVEVRDILGLAGGFQLLSGGTGNVDPAAGILAAVHKCAMVGLFEPGQGSGTNGAYDAAAVQRFADLGG